MTGLALPTDGNHPADDAHVGDIRGALGTIKHGDTAARRGLSAKVRTLLAIVGPGLIVMCGDNDAGAFSTYGIGALRFYLAAASVLVVVKIIQLALG